MVVNLFRGTIELSLANIPDLNTVREMLKSCDLVSRGELCKAFSTPGDSSRIYRFGTMKYRGRGFRRLSDRIIVNFIQFEYDKETYTEVTIKGSATSSALSRILDSASRLWSEYKLPMEKYFKRPYFQFF
jgi:hypothetical protein